jgi:hypothetical protein
MKKLIVVSIVAAFFAACNNKPAVSESATKVGNLNHWVDSVKTLATGATTCDSATWAGWDAAYNTELAGINEAELAEADKTTLADAKTKWADAGTAYTACITKAKEEAAKAAAAMDSTKMMAPEVAPMEPAKKEEAKKH